MPGIHLFGELSGCPETSLRLCDEQRVRIRSIIADAGFTQVAEACHEFQNGGYTFVICLAESHVALHTWIDERRVTLDVFACGIRDDHAGAARSVFERIGDLFLPQQRTFEEVAR